MINSIKEAFETAVRMVFSPQTVWVDISKEKDNIYRKFLLPIWGVIVSLSFIGGWLVATNGTIELGFKNMFFKAFTLFGGFHLSSFLLNEYLEQLTDIDKDIHKARTFVAYSSSLIYLVEVLVAILDEFFFLWLFVLYTFYIVYIGAEKYFKITIERRSNFMIITSITILIMPLILKSVLSMMTKI